jgi:hypothetical protein
VGFHQRVVTLWRDVHDRDRSHRLNP